MNPNPIDAWDATLPAPLSTIAASLRKAFAAAVPQAEPRLFHGSPVWFLDDNPLFGYSESKGALALLFWSGQSFSTPGLTAKGKHKAAEVRFAALSDPNKVPLSEWLQQAVEIQWDYKNIVANRGVLNRLV